MRNLKRVLSLALASAMLLGMMVMGAGAADTKKPLTDLDKVVNKDAVNLMVDLAVITGKPDGSFAPTETVDRATMSTLIYKIMTGETNADSFKGTSNLKDVAGTWAEGFINYCSSLKIVSGDGTNFYPTNKVTVVQAAKMLLVAIGYDAELSKYQNDANWSINIMRDAKKAGILDEIGQKATDELTRDNAAQMVNNTLFAKIVAAQTGRDQGEAYLIKYEPTGSTLAEDTYSMIAVTATIDTVTGGKVASVSAATPDKGNVAKNAIEKAGIAAGTDKVGKNATIYVKGTISYNTADGSVKSLAVDKVYSTTLAAGATNVLGTSMDGTTYAKLTTKDLDKKKFVAEVEAGATFYENGKASDATKVATAIDGKPGVIVELIDTDGNSKIDLVKVTAKTAKQVDGAVVTRTYKDELQVSVPGVIGYTDASKVTGYEDLKDKDYVLTYTDNDKNVYIELAETVTGKITGKKSAGDVLVNGTYYGWSGLANSADVSDVLKTDGKLDTDNEYLFVLDNNNTISLIENITNESTAKTAIVLEQAYVTGGGVGASKYLEVKLLLADGTTEIAKVKKVGGTEPTGEQTAATFINCFYDYTVDSDGKYTLTATTDATALSSAFKVENGKTPVTTGYTANAKTIYLVQKGTGSKAEYSAYTGYASVPTMNIAASSASKVVPTAAGGKIAKYVFLTTDKFIGDSEELNYVYLIDPTSYNYVAKDGDVAEHYDYAAIVDGEKTTISVSAELASSVKAGLYNLSLTDGIAAADDFTVVKNQIALKTFAKTDTIKDGVVIVAAIESGKAYTYDKDTAVYVIELTMKADNTTVKDADVMNSTNGGNYKFTPEDGYTYQAVVAPAKEGGELLSALYIFQTLVPAVAP